MTKKRIFEQGGQTRRGGLMARMAAFGAMLASIGRSEETGELPEFVKNMYHRQSHDPARISRKRDPNRHTRLDRAEAKRERRAAVRHENHLRCQQGYYRNWRQA